MMAISYFVLALLLSTATLTQAYFYVPNFMSTLPFQGGSAYATRGDSIYIFGGENATSSHTNKLYQLQQTSTSFTWREVPQTNPPPGALYGQAMVSNTGKTMLLLGGMSDQTANQEIPLQLYSYNFDTTEWHAAPTNNNLNATASIPYNRQLFSATYDNGTTLYIYGGSLNNTAIFPDFYKVDVGTSNFVFTELPNPGIPRYGHTASLLSDGKLVIIGGVGMTPQGSGLASMEQLYIFDTKSNQWTVQATQAGSGGVFPSTRSSHNAIVTSDDKIIVFGGDNGASQRDRMYLNAIAILDTKTWTWEVPQPDGIPPSRRSYAVAGILDNDQHLTVAFGAALNTYYNDINVYSLADSKWLQSFDDNEDGSGSGVSAGLIAGVTIAAVVLVAIILFLLWRFQSYIRWLFTRIHHDIWKPRTGEPVWAETTRIVSQIFLLFLFICFLVFVIRQAVNSPNVTQRIEDAAAEVDVPDVRFCFDGYPTYGAGDARNPGVVCQTDTGYSCSHYIQPLNMSIFTPTFASNLGAVGCFLFRGDKDFKMTSTSGQNNGSRLLFSIFGDQTATFARVHVSVYPKEMDPNVKVYNINDDVPVIMSDFDVLSWQNNERNDIQATNIYDIEPFTYNAMSYNLIDHRYLQDVGWNYVGFSPITNSTPEIESNFRSEAPNPNYTMSHADMGFIAIYPDKYAEFTDREVKMYTLLNALGFVGGIFGLLIAVQTWLFGFRPRSPWGVVHRWSVGDMKRSLLRGLQSNFKTTDSTVPLVHPLHPRFSMQNMADLGYESEGQRISRVEERMQILELLFKAYYVDDEIFRSLDNATKNMPNSPGGAGAAAGPLFPSEKGAAGPATGGHTDMTRSNTGGFSHMFNHRQSVNSVNSDTNSQQNLNDHRHWLQTNNDNIEKKNILVLDSSFNPPTKAHVALVHTTLDHFPPNTFTGCLFLFTCNNVDKPLSGASPPQRLAMMTLIADHMASFVPTAVGTTASGRFIDKAKALEETLDTNNDKKHEFYFIVGHDTMVRLLDPKYYQGVPVEKALAPFFQHSRLICVDRPGFGDMESFWEQVKQDHPWLLQEEENKKVERIELKNNQAQNISSTLARSMVFKHQWDQLNTVVDPKISDYIRQHKLYL
ncbi:hypothetical protein BDA99DRAFT_561472 [Phascolomyces articulosus]|uniref:Nicotinamide-nucleotide adenylyltransferase n=1 Tax=Phascolomyces articulosus TaxID=60185 RepID=A0AAD5JWX5_9FUNG|nr:hypothetical protein BDA99DRAFT_561472 [Phascolomyces articulosus]